MADLLDEASDHVMFLLQEPCVITQEDVDRARRMRDLVCPMTWQQTEEVYHRTCVRLAREARVRMMEEILNA